MKKKVPMAIDGEINDWASINYKSTLDRYTCYYNDDNYLYLLTNKGDFEENKNLTYYISVDIDSDYTEDFMTGVFFNNQGFYREDDVVNYIDEVEGITSAIGTFVEYRISLDYFIEGKFQLSHGAWHSKDEYYYYQTNWNNFFIDNFDDYESNYDKNDYNENDNYENNSEKIEEERLEKELIEKERIYEEKLEKEKNERERIERERKRKDKLEKERIEKERNERKRIERERKYKEKLEREKRERERIERERQKWEKKERERIERERNERIRNEQIRKERERKERLRKEKERKEKERREKEERTQKKSGIRAFLNSIRNASLKRKVNRYIAKGIEKRLNLKGYNPTKIANYSKKFINIPYRYGQTNRYGTDCSGLTYMSFKAYSINIPRTSIEQGRTGVIISDRRKLKKGDMVFFHRTYKSSTLITHVGLYIGNGKFINANSYYKKVVIDDLYSNYWNDKFLYGTRGY
jgi:cell wall-associated NlpC family hydrolase